MFVFFVFLGYGFKLVFDLCFIKLTLQYEYVPKITNLDVMNLILNRHPRRFLEMMEARAKGYRSPGDANGQSPSSGSQSPVVPAGASSTGSSSPGTPQQPPVAGQNPQLPSTSPPVDAQIPIAPALPPVPVPAPAPSPSPAQQPQKRSFISRLFGSTASPEAPTAGQGECCT